MYSPTFWFKLRLPACVQVQETSVAQYRDVCKCKKHQLRSTEMCASATYVNIPTHTKDVTCHVRVCKCKKHQLRSTEMFASARNISCVAPRCVQVQETSVAQYRDVCKCKKHQLRSTEMCASARNISCVAPRCVQVQRTLTSPPPPPTPPIPKT